MDKETHSTNSIAGNADVRKLLLHAAQALHKRPELWNLICCCLAADAPKAYHELLKTATLAEEVLKDARKQAA